MDWKKNAAVKASVLDRILKKMLEKEIPAQLVDLVNNISMISSKDIESLKTTHKQDFKRFVQQASGLTVVIWWHSYENSIYRKIWPPPRLSRAIDELVKTVDIAHKLLARKCEKKYWKKRMFVILDLGKDIKDYLGKLDSVAADIQKSQPNHVVDINSILLEALDKHKKTQLPEAKVKGTVHVDSGAKKVVVNKEPVAEGSRQQEVPEKSSSIKAVNQKVRIGKDDPVEHKGLARKNEKGSGKGRSVEDKEGKEPLNEASRRLEEEQIATKRKSRAANHLKIRTSSKEDVCEEKSMKPRYGEEEGSGGGTFQRVRTASPTQPKKRKEGNQWSESPRKGKRTSDAGPARRSPSTPPSPQSGIFYGPTSNHYGIVHTDISNVGNDNSVNFYRS